MSQGKNMHESPSNAASVDDFARNLVDDLRAAKEIADRDAADTGERMTLDELIRSQGFDPEDFDV